MQVGYFMNVSLNGLFTNYYNFIRDKFSNLSPLQKKVTIVSIACFSFATVGYCIYRFYYFQAHRISGKQKEEEDENILLTPQRNQKEVRQSINETTTSKKSQSQNSEYKTELEKESKRIKEIAQETILKNKSEASIR